MGNIWGCAQLQQILRGHRCWLLPNKKIRVWEMPHKKVIYLGSIDQFDAIWLKFRTYKSLYDILYNINYIKLLYYIVQYTKIYLPVQWEVNEKAPSSTVRMLWQYLDRDRDNVISQAAEHPDLLWKFERWSDVWHMIGYIICRKAASICIHMLYSYAISWNSISFFKSHDKFASFWICPCFSFFSLGWRTYSWLSRTWRNVTIHLCGGPGDFWAWT